MAFIISVPISNLQFCKMTNQSWYWMRWQMLTLVGAVSVTQVMPDKKDLNLVTFDGRSLLFAYVRSTAPPGLAHMPGIDLVSGALCTLQLGMSLLHVLCVHFLWQVTGPGQLFSWLWEQFKRESENMQETQGVSSGAQNQDTILSVLCSWPTQVIWLCPDAWWENTTSERHVCRRGKETPSVWFIQCMFIQRWNKRESLALLCQENWRKTPS